MCGRIALFTPPGRLARLLEATLAASWAFTTLRCQSFWDRTCQQFWDTEWFLALISQIERRLIYERIAEAS